MKQGKKIASVFVCMLVIASSVTILSTQENIKVKAAGGGQQGTQGNTIGLDYNYMWNVTTNISNAVHNAYNVTEIPKGRAFGSKGCEEYTKDYIYHQMNDIDKLNLNNVKVEKLEPLAYPFNKRYYASLMDVDGYKLIIEHPDYTEETNLPSNVPLTEIFPIVSGVRSRPGPLGQFTYNYTMLESDNVRVITTFEIEGWPLGGTLTGVYKNVTCLSLNGLNCIVGNVTLIDDSSELPADQTGYVFLINETDGCADILDNVTNNASVILLHSDSTKYNVSNVSKYTFSLKRVDDSDENLTNITERLENGEIIFADNFYNNSWVTFTCDLLSSDWPDYNFMLIVELDMTNNKINWYGQSYGILEWLIHTTGILWFANSLPHDYKCKGLFVYSDKLDGTHYMLLHSTYWGEITYFPFYPCLPIFSVNYSVGNFLANHFWDTSNTVTGYIDQVYYNGLTSSTGVDAYDIVGHINIPKSPDDKIVVISNRQDSWWGECSLDSGAGAGIVFGIAKYFTEHQITPKYNITFLQDTGEEMQYRGAQFYSDNHSDDNIILFIGADQLGMEQPGSYLDLKYKDSDTRKIVWAIANETHYDQRTKYRINHSNAFKDDDPKEKWGDGTDGHVWKRREMYDNSNPCDTIVVNKEGWTSHHQTGLNFNEGDSLKNTNRSDLNITFELFWNITKYFTVNPNCWFHSTTYESVGSSNNTSMDSVKVTFKVESVLPSDLVMVNVTLMDASSQTMVSHQLLNYTVNKTGVTETVTMTMPQGVSEDDYYIVLKLYNSTGRINKTLGLNDQCNETRTSPMFRLNRYHSFGYNRAGGTNMSVEDVITGSYFKPNTDGFAENITAYVYGKTGSQDKPTYKCMIYRKNDASLVGTTEEKQPESTGWERFSFGSNKPQLLSNTDYVLVVWGDNTTKLDYDNNFYLHGRRASLSYGTPPDPVQWTVSESKNYSIFCSYTIHPIITNVSAAPQTVGFGYNVTISADVIDPLFSLLTVKVNITYPDHTHGNYTMTLTTESTYQYLFNDTWQIGQYNYTIWATDSFNNRNRSGGYHFHVSAEATISIATLQDSYTGNQYINITDPPNPSENLTLVGRGLTWNTYYNASSGNNILETYIGPVNYQQDNSTWTPINNSLSQLTSNHPAYNYGYRTGNDHGLYGVYFKSNAQNDWPVAFTYNRSDYPATYAVRSKLVGVGYVDPASNWAYQYLQNVQSSQGQSNSNSITYSDVFTGTDVTWSYGNTELKEEITLSNATKIVLQNHPPSMYGLNNESSYLVFITKLDHQNLDMYNASGVLTGNVTISDAGVDFKDALGQFKCALPLGEAYELNNESVRQKLTYRIVHLNGNTFLLSGLKISDLTAMMFPVVIDPTLTVESLSNDGYISSSNTNYNTARNASSGTVNSSATYLSIGQKKVSGFPGTYYIYRGFVFFNASALPSNAYLDNAILSLYKKDDYSVTDFLLTIQNGQPTYPHNPLQSTDYNKTHYSGNGGSLNTVNFTTGRNNITLTNLSWVNKTGLTKLCLRSSRDINGNTPTGNEYVNVWSHEAAGINDWPKLVIIYRNQSKIKNTGLTNMKGYLLIQVQFYDSKNGTWVLENDKVNETSPRTITSGSQLPLDKIFNGLIRASDLAHGVGTYRVYTAFRDPEGNILKTNTGSELKAWWQFSKT